MKRLILTFVAIALCLCLCRGPNSCTQQTPRREDRTSEWAILTGDHHW